MSTLDHRHRLMHRKFDSWISLGIILLKLYNNVYNLTTLSMGPSVNWLLLVWVHPYVCLFFTIIVIQFLSFVALIQTCTGVCPKCWSWCSLCCRRGPCTATLRVGKSVAPLCLRFQVGRLTSLTRWFINFLLFCFLFSFFFLMCV